MILRCVWVKAAIAVGLLSGCDNGLALPLIERPSFLGGSSANSVETGPLPALALLGGAAIAVGPEAYCVDPSASRPVAGFAMIAACDAMAGGTRRPADNGLITIQVGAAGSAVVNGGEDALAAFLASHAGGAVLSRTGDAETVTLGATRAGDGLVIVQFDDTSATPLAGATRREWRSFIDLNGRLVTVSVHGLEAAPLSNAAGDRLLDNAIQALIAANAPQSETET